MESNHSQGLGIFRQCELLGSCSSFYCEAIDENPLNLKPMRKMGLTPIYQKPSTSKPQLGHEIYPYLLHGVETTEPGHVWCADVS